MSMRSFLLGPALYILKLIVVLDCLSASSAAFAEVHRYLYASTPDGAQLVGRSGTGILIFDIDNGHKFVKRIEIPIFTEGLRGFTGSAKTQCVYYSTTNRRLGCFDLEKEEVVWEKTYEGGCDRTSITQDGRKLYVPTGWWHAGRSGGLLVINAEDGRFIKRIKVGPQAHNSIVSLDGRFVSWYEDYVDRS